MGPRRASGTVRRAPKGPLRASGGARRGREGVPKDLRRGPEGPPDLEGKSGVQDLGVRSGSRSVNTDVSEGPPGRYIYKPPL